MEYRVTVDPRPTIPVKPYWLSIRPCLADPQWSVPGTGHGAHRRSYEFTVPEDGRIVATGAHLHGGADQLILSEPECGHRTLVDSRPFYAPAGDQLYKVRPLLHEPGPISTGSFLSETGIGVHRGERLRITSTYDNEYPHPQAMGIMHLYVAPGKPPGAPCEPLPGDARDEHLRADSVAPAPLGVPARPRSPRIVVPLNALDKRGRVGPIPWPAGSTEALDSGATIDISGNRFDHTKISLPVGASLTWRFSDRAYHNVVLANGPWSAGAPGATYLGPNASYTTQFPLPGRYQLFCQFHPLTMHQQVLVGDAGGR
jgi:plastocyanin